VTWAGFREEEDAAGYFPGVTGYLPEPWHSRSDLCRSAYDLPESQDNQPRARTDGEQPRSQLVRLLDELGIELIAAHTPQAKGRIERLWETFQNRLVNALRETGATNIVEANRVLESFLPKFNAYFRVAPAQPGSAYLPWPLVPSSCGMKMSCSASRQASENPIWPMTWK